MLHGLLLSSFIKLTNPHQHNRITTTKAKEKIKFYLKAEPFSSIL